MSDLHRVFIFGDSHAQPLVNALTAWSFVDEAGNDGVFANMVDCGLISQDLIFETKDRGDQLNPLLARALEIGGLMNRFVDQYLPAQASVGLLFGYADVHMMGFTKLFFEGFDERLLQGGPGAPSGAAHYAMLRALVRARLGRVEKAVALLTTKDFALFLMSGPPPTSDAAVGLHQPTVDPPPSGARRAVWQATQEVMAEIAHRYGARLLTDQSRYTDADGFLRPEYVSDGVHANAEHGRLYLTDIVGGLGLALTATPRHPASETEAPEGALPPPDVEPPLAEVPAEPAGKRGLARSLAQALARLR